MQYSRVYNIGCSCIIARRYSYYYNKRNKSCFETKKVLDHSKKYLDILHPSNEAQAMLFDIT